MPTDVTEMVWQVPWPRWVILLVVGALLASWLHASWQRPWLVGALRLAATFALLLLFMQPARLLKSGKQTPMRLAVVVDRSYSMQPAARQTAVKDFLQGLRPALERGPYKTEWYDLDGVLPDGKLPPAQGSHSNLAAAITRTFAGELPLAGVVLLSDGADTHAAPISSNVPINTVAVVDDAPAGVTLDAPLFDAISFVRNTAVVSMPVRQRGFDGKALQVALSCNGNDVSVTNVELAASQNVTFKFKPDRLGTYHCSLTVRGDFSGPVFPPQRQFTMQVLRDKTRVLHVAGAPSWDVRFLRQLLKTSGNCDLVSFFILRTFTDDVSIPESELSLIPFPTEQLFTRELKNFDVLILQNFDFRPYNMAMFIPHVAQAVRDGLGLVMLGGSQSLSNGGFGMSELQDVLPVRLGFDAPALLLDSLTLRETALAKQHPVVAHLSMLPQVSRVNQNIRPLPEAQVLWETADGAPFLAVRDAGKGRSLSVSTDNLWRWRFGKHAADYQRFWQNALSWLVHDTDTAQLASPAPAPLPAALEMLHLAPEPSRLQEIAAASGGAALQISDTSPWQKLKLLPQPPMQVTSMQLTPLWDTPWLMGLAASLLVAEWFVRRR